MKYLIIFVVGIAASCFGQFSNLQCLEYDGTDYDSTLEASADSFDFSGSDGGTFSFWFWSTDNRSDNAYLNYICGEYSSKPRTYFLHYHHPAPLKRLQSRQDWGGTPDVDEVVTTGSESAPDIQTWYHGALTFSNGSATDTIVIYLNGQPEDTVTINGSGHSGGVDWPGGWRFGLVAGNFFKGKIDEYAHFDYELTSDQIQTVYNNGVPNDLTPLNPKLWFRYETTYTDSTVDEFGTVSHFPSGTDNDPTYTSLSGQSIYVESDEQKANLNQGVKLRELRSIK